MKNQQSQTCLHVRFSPVTHPPNETFGDRITALRALMTEWGPQPCSKQELPSSICMGFRTDLIPWGTGYLRATGVGALSKDIEVLRAATSWVLWARWFMGDSCREVRSQSGEDSQLICWAEVTAATHCRHREATFPSSKITPIGKKTVSKNLDLFTLRVSPVKCLVGAQQIFVVE